MAGDVTGTPRKVLVDGVPYRVRADTNIKQTGGQFENTSVPTSGDNIRKMVKRSQTAEGLTLTLNGAEFATLKAVSEDLEDHPLGMEYPNGDLYTADGWIEFESHESEENTGTIMMCPRSNVWEQFLA